MTIEEVLAGTINGVHAITGIYGVGAVGSQVKQFHDDPQHADDDLYFAVGGVHLYHFFANSSTAFEKEEPDLWEAICQAVGKTSANIAVPTNLSINTTLAEIAVYVFAKLD